MSSYKSGVSLRMYPIRKFASSMIPSISKTPSNRPIPLATLLLRHLIPSFQPSDVATLNEEKTLLVVMGATDTLNTGNQWIAGPGKEIDGRYVQTCTAGEVVLEVMSERPWRNEINPLDVLIVINHLNRSQGNGEGEGGARGGTY